MPRKYRGAYHDHMREYLAYLRPPGTTSEKGVVRQKTIGEYRSMLTEAGELLGFPPPKQVTLDQLKALERQVGGNSDRTITRKLTTIRAFLKWCGNDAAQRWKVRRNITPYRGGVFLNERQVARLHQAAAALGPFAELVISLAVDNGLRCVDITNLTKQNAQEFLDWGESDIRGKGRDGGKIALQMFSSYTREPLLRYLEERRRMVERTGQDPEQLVLYEVTHAKYPYLRSPEYRQWRRLTDVLSEEIGIKFRMHDLRRTLGNRLWRRGHPLELIAKILRHESSLTTLRAYIGVDANDMRSALDSLCPEAVGQSPKVV